MEEKRYTTGEFAKAIGRSICGVQKWDRKGILIAKRTLGGRRYYTDADIQAVNEREGVVNGK